MENEIHNITVIDVVDNDDGTATINLDISDEFIDWFKKKEGLKRWSQKRFEKFFIRALTIYLEEEPPAPPSQE